MSEHAGPRGWRGVGAIAVVALTVLAGCTAPEGMFTATPEPHPTVSEPLPTLTPTPYPPPGPVAPTGEPTVVAEGLVSPWSLVRLPTGSTLISERDTARILELTSAGELREAGIVAGVAHGGEGGLLGLAVSPDAAWLYAYFTSDVDNRIVRMPLSGEPGGYSLAAATDILTGIPRASNHNGGRLGFGPDGMLYATTGDAGRGETAQDPASLAGKILRMTPEGAVPDDNPLPGLLTYSFGHRNPQGIAWDRFGQLWASEFGQNTWDELNVITPGSNYGWPIVEGASGNADFANPVYAWRTRDASPSGLAVVRDTIWMAALRGEGLWMVLDGVHVPAGRPDLEGVVTASAHFTGLLGRIRDVAAGPAGTLWLVTNNTDGRGDPRPGDDKIYQIDLAPIS